MILLVKVPWFNLRIYLFPWDFDAKKYLWWWINGRPLGIRAGTKFALWFEKDIYASRWLRVWCFWRSITIFRWCAGASHTWFLRESYTPRYTDLEAEQKRKIKVRKNIARQEITRRHFNDRLILRRIFYRQNWWNLNALLVSDR